MIFRRTWFDNTLGRGMHRHPSGIVDVRPRRHYANYDSFIVLDQSEQVYFIPYPSLRPSVANDWWESTKLKKKMIMNLLMDNPEDEYVSEDALEYSCDDSDSDSESISDNDV
ncbi:hypothetical protein F2Q68_00039059 [Brassica cretica]|uniref:DUF4216 domain-containing protein n=1 Tax=Brassica cretica TaxID=69181 RepID=A0A8S9MK57_BRACR|nr:hypothetical protein F2Q68_00039059 [Brassica cretica]